MYSIALMSKRGSFRNKREKKEIERKEKKRKEDFLANSFKPGKQIRSANLSPCRTRHVLCTSANRFLQMGLKKNSISVQTHYTWPIETDPCIHMKKKKDNTEKPPKKPTPQNPHRISSERFQHCDWHAMQVKNQFSKM